jgi:hypothetical protein
LALACRRSAYVKPERTLQFVASILIEEST